MTKQQRFTKQLFVLDGLGALSSALLLSLVLPQYQQVFGMPAETLYLLAALPVLFVGFDAISYLQYPKNSKGLLRLIAGMNLSYCLISMGFLVHHYSQLTKFGLAYFLMEVLIVALLAIVELKTAARLKT